MPETCNNVMLFLAGGLRVHQLRALHVWAPCWATTLLKKHGPLPLFTLVSRAGTCQLNIDKDFHFAYDFSGP